MKKLMLTLTSSLLLAGAAQAQSLTMAMSAQPDVLDPHRTSATSAFQVMKSLYDTLAEVGKNGKLTPALAESWTIAKDGLSWTFKLRAGVKFHDDTTLDAADVKATIERLQDKASPKASEFRAITKIETPDARTVVMRLSAPNPALLASLSSGWGAILPSEKMASGHDFANKPVGTGPFTLDRWTRDSFVRLSRNPDYYKGAPRLATVTLRFVSESALQMQGLLSGDFQIIDSIPIADIDKLEANKAVKVVEEPSSLVLVASINNRRPYLSDPRVRQALNYAVDKQVVLKVAYGGGSPVGTFYEAGSPWTPDDVKPYPQDIARAKSLLQQAKVPADWTIELVLPQNYPTHVTAGQIIQNQLEQVGIKAKIRLVEWGVWLSDVYSGKYDYDITVVGHTGKLDPTGRLTGYGDPAKNYVGYNDSGVVKLLAEAAQSTDADEREALYARALRQFNVDAPFIYLGTPSRRYATRANVQGFWITPALDTLDFREARLN